MPNPLNAEQPPYQQAASVLRAEITVGRFKPGQRLPAYRELQERFGIANMTARSAIAVLRSEGLVHTVQGRGTYVLERTAGLLTFERIAEELKGQIVSGRLKPGRFLPSQAELMKAYGASSLTIQKALRLLTDEGLVMSRQGRGTFVPAPGQAREPGTLGQPGRPPADLTEALERLSDVVSGMQQLINELAGRVSALETHHDVEHKTAAQGTPSPHDQLAS